MSYKESLEAAGATVFAFGEFGSYQGDWWAKVKFDGQSGFVHGYYGSCSGCDAFEAEFGWKDPNQEALAKFGADYLSEIMTFEQAIKEASKNLAWDIDAQEAVDFIKKNQDQ